MRARLAVLAVVLSGSAFGQQASRALSDARAHLKALRFEPAVQRAGEGLAAGDATPAEVADLYFTLGQSSSVLGRTDEAVDAYARALELSPGLTLPPGSSPKLAGPWRDAVARLAGARLTATPLATLLDDGRVRVVVEVRGDPLGLVERGVVEARASPDAAWQTVPLTRTLPPQAWLTCAQPPCAFAVKLFDRQNNTLLEAGTRQAPLLTDGRQAAAARAPIEALPTDRPVADPVKPEPTVTVAPLAAAPVAEQTSSATRAWYQSPWPYVAAGAACAAVGAVFAVKYSADERALAEVQANKAEHSYAEAQALDAARQRDLGVMVGGFVATAAFGVTAVVLW